MILTLLRKSVTLDVIVPLIVLVAYLGIFFLARGVLPSGDELLNDFGGVYKQYGYYIVFISALIEATVLINLFVPGLTAIILGLLFARAGHTEFVTIMVLIIIGANIGYQLDYQLGRLGVGRLFAKFGYENFLKAAKKQLQRFGKRGLVLGYIHANLGALMSFTTGATNFPWFKFTTISVLATFVWTTLWGLLIYSLGNIFLMLISRYSYLIILFVIAAMVLIRMMKGEEAK